MSSRRKKNRQQRVYLPGTLLLLLTSLFLPMLKAQPVGPDIRLLDLFTVQVVPEELQIESGHTIDGVVLAVWGTMHEVEGEVLPVLVIESKIGSQRRLTDALSRPFGEVAVLRATDRFLVIWNDAREDAPGIHGRYVARDGANLSDEFLLVPNSTMTGRPVEYDMDGVTTVIWQEFASGRWRIHSVRVAHDGRLVEPSRFEEEGSIAINESFPPNSGGLFLRTTEGVVRLDRSGEVDRRSIPEGRFSRPFLFDGPTGMITVNYQGKLVRYDPIDAEDPDWIGEGPTGLIPGRDSIGYYVASFSHHPIIPYFVTLLVRENHYVRGRDGAPLSLVTYDTVYSIGYHNDPSPTVWTSDSRITMLEDGLIRYEFIWHVRFRPGASGRDYSSDSRVVQYIDSRDSTDAPGGGLIIPTVRRTSNIESSSCIVTGVGGLPDNLFSTTIAERRLDDPSARPVLREVDGKLIAGGLMESGKRFSASLSWDNLTAPRYARIERGSAMSEASYVRGWNSSGQVYFIRDTSSFLDNGQWITNTYTYYYWWTVGAEGWKRVYLSRDYVGGPVSFPTPTNPLLRYNPQDDRVYSLATYVPPYRPSRYYYNFIRVTALGTDLDSVGGVRYNQSTPTVDFVPVDTQAILHYRTQDSAGGMGDGTRWVNHRPENSVVQPLPEGTRHVVRQRLFGNRYIRLTTEPQRNRIGVEIYAIGGGRLQSIDLPLDGDTAAPFVAQNRTDSSIVVLTQGESGPLAHLLGPDLSAVLRGSGQTVGPLRLSERSGTVGQANVVVAGDTIYAIWTDYRRGVPDIYLNAVALPTDRYNDTDPESYDFWEQYRTGDPEVIRQLTPEQRQDIFGFAIYGVTPNPTYAEVTLRIGAAYSLGAYVEIFDAAGKRLYRGVLDLRPGMRYYRVPEEFGESGVYTLRISSPEYADEVLVVYIGA